MRVAIVGAGIGGLTAALFLKKNNIDVQLYEQADVIKPVGAGITLAHNAMQVYKMLGLDKAILSAGSQLDAINITTPDLKCLSKTDTAIFDKRYGVHAVAIQRGRLQTILMDALPMGVVQLGKKCQQVLEAEKLSLLFADGSQAECATVIAADGINSKIRSLVFPQSEIRHAQQLCWRGIAVMSLPEQWQYILNEAWGRGSRFGFVPISPTEVYWYALCNKSADIVVQGKTELIKLFAAYHPIVNEIILHTPPEQIIKADIQDLKPLKSWYKGRVCLIGDAAHATTPNMGQGACQAIEDAYVLADCLQRYSFNSAFAIYQRLRIKKAQEVVNTSWVLGKVAQLQNPVLAAMRDVSMRLMPASINRSRLGKLYTLR